VPDVNDLRRIPAEHLPYQFQPDRFALFFGVVLGAASAACGRLLGGSRGAPWRGCPSGLKMGELRPPLCGPRVVILGLRLRTAG
jgi:hypothetical protein